MLYSSTIVEHNFEVLVFPFSDTLNFHSTTFAGKKLFHDICLIILVTFKGWWIKVTRKINQGSM